MPEAIENLFEKLMCPVNASTMGFETLSADLTPQSTSLGIRQGLHQGGSKGSCIVDTNSRAPDFKNRSGLSDILDMRAEQDRTAHVGGFDEVVPPDWNQRPSDEGDIGHGIDPRQLA